jgi:hypothetical protein
LDIPLGLGYSSGLVRHPSNLDIPPLPGSSRHAGTSKRAESPTLQGHPSRCLVISTRGISHRPGVTQAGLSHPPLGTSHRCGTSCVSGITRLSRSSQRHSGHLRRPLQKLDRRGRPSRATSQQLLGYTDAWDVQPAWGDDSETEEEELFEHWQPGRIRSTPERPTFTPTPPCAFHPPRARPPLSVSGACFLA